MKMKPLSRRTFLRGMLGGAAVAALLGGTQRQPGRRAQQSDVDQLAEAQALDVTSWGIAGRRCPCIVLYLRI